MIDILYRCILYERRICHDGNKTLGAPVRSVSATLILREAQRQQRMEGLRLAAAVGGRCVCLDSPLIRVRVERRRAWVRLLQLLLVVLKAQSRLRRGSAHRRRGPFASCCRCQGSPRSRSIRRVRSVRSLRAGRRRVQWRGPDGGAIHALQCRRIGFSDGAARRVSVSVCVCVSVCVRMLELVLQLVWVRPGQV